MEVLKFRCPKIIPPLLELSNSTRTVGATHAINQRGVIDSTVTSSIRHAPSTLPWR